MEYPYFNKHLNSLCLKNSPYLKSSLLSKNSLRPSDNPCLKSSLLSKSSRRLRAYLCLQIFPTEFFPYSCRCRTSCYCQTPYQTYPHLLCQPWKFHVLKISATAVNFRTNPNTYYHYPVSLNFQFNAIYGNSIQQPYQQHKIIIFSPTLRSRIAYRLWIFQWFLYYISRSYSIYATAITLFLCSNLTQASFMFSFLAVDSEDAVFFSKPAYVMELPYRILSY